MSALASGRTIVNSAVPADIAERISDVPMSIAEEREQERQRQRRIIDATDAILEGDVLTTWAWQDYAYELVALVHRLRNVGATRHEIGDAAVKWLRDTAERQARREVEEQS